MTHDERLPGMRFGAGLLNKLEGGEAFVLPVRDDGPIAQPKRIDGQMGIKEKDESIERAQAREGTEETAFVRETGDTVELGIPETLRGTELQDNLGDTYRKARRDDSSPLPQIDGIFYFEASQEVPAGMPTVEAEQGGYETGYTWEVTDDVSMELVNDHEVGIGLEEIVSGDIVPYDLEHMVTDEGVIHFDRPTVLLEPTDDQITVFRSGEIEYQGDVSGFRDFVSSNYGWDMSEVETAATAKVQARMDAYGDELGSQTAEEFVNDEYMEAVSGLGDAFRGFPEP